MNLPSSGQATPTVLAVLEGANDPFRAKTARELAMHHQSILALSPEEAHREGPLIADRELRAPGIRRHRQFAGLVQDRDLYRGDGVTADLEPDRAPLRRRALPHTI